MLKDFRIIRKVVFFVITLSALVLWSCGSDDDTSYQDRDTLYYKINDIEYKYSKDSEFVSSEKQGTLGYAKLHKISEDKIEITFITAAVKDKADANNIEKLQLITNGKPLVVGREGDSWAILKDDGQLDKHKVVYKWGDKSININSSDEYDGEESHFSFVLESKIKNNKELLNAIKSFWQANLDKCIFCDSDGLNGDNELLFVFDDEARGEDKDNIDKYDIKFIE